jgi:hypothetical protein
MRDLGRSVLSISSRVVPHFRRDQRGTSMSRQLTLSKEHCTRTFDMFSFGGQIWEHAPKLHILHECHA